MPSGGACMWQSKGQYLVLQAHQSITSTSFNMSKTEHTGPHKIKGSRKETMSFRHYRNLYCLCLYTFLSLNAWVCVGVRVCALICFQEHPVRSFQMQVSTRREVCLYEPRRMFSQMLPTTLNNFFPLFPSRRSWEESSSQSHINLKAKMRQDVTSSWTLAFQNFALSVSLSLPPLFGEIQEEKKKENLPLANQLLQLRWIRHNCNQSW